MPTAKQIKRKHLAKTIPEKILRTLLITGAITIAASSPHFIANLIKNLNQSGFKFREDRNARKTMSSTFSRLKKKGLLSYETKNGQLYIKLTPEGKKVAGKYQINELEVKKQKKWDNKWHILIFDIPEQTRIKRDALRGKLKELGFAYIQKSVWVHPYPCTEELKLLKQFFGFTDRDYVFIEATKITTHEKTLKKRFNL